MALETWLLFVAVSILPAISPGPAILLAVSNTLRYGSRPTVFSATGNALGLVVLGFCVAFGLAAVMAASATAFLVLKLVGGGYLIYLGIKLWRDRQALHIDTGRPAAVHGGRYFLAQAFLVSVTNPKAILVLTALLPPFLDMQRQLMPQVAILSVTYAVICFANHLFIAYAGGWMRRFLLSERRLTYLRRGLGTLFVGFGVALATMQR